MKIKQLSFTVFSMVVFSASSATFAQSENFTGLSVGANFTQTAATHKRTEVSTYTDTYNYGDTTSGVNLQAAYGIKAGDSMVINVGGTYSLNDYKAGGDSSSQNSYDSIGKDKKHYTLYIEPGFVLSDSTLAYGKLAYHNLTHEVKATSSNTSLNESIKFSNIGFGAGVRTMLSKNTFLQAEMGLVNFTEKSYALGRATYKEQPKLTYGSLGVGYKF
jgi:opacity protein-like surface antigen